MSTYRRNICRTDSTSRPRAIVAGLALALASGAALADGAHRFVFSAYSDAPGGSEVVAGRYGAALEELKSQAGDIALDPLAANTNRCIAYSMTLRWQEAHAACNAAVSAASEQRLGVPAWLSGLRASDDRDLALAYANRAVLHWLSQDEPAAAEDLTRARELAPRADFVARNIAALNVHLTVARATTAVPKS